MAKYRNIFTSIWSDEFFDEGLNRSEKLDFIYLLTNSKTSQCGIYHLRVKEMAMELGYSIEEANKSLERFIKYGKVLYDRSTSEIAILNWGKFNHIGSPNVMKCIQKELSGIKSYELVQAMQKRCRHQQTKQLFLNRQKQIKLTTNSENTEKGVLEGCGDGAAMVNPSESIDNQLVTKPLGEEERKKNKKKKEKENYNAHTREESLSSFDEKKVVEDEDLVPVFDSPCSLQNPVDRKTGKRLDKEVFRFLKNFFKNNIHFVNDIKQTTGFEGNISPILESYLLNLEEKGERYKLMPRTDSYESFSSWLSKILAGWEKFVKNKKKWDDQDEAQNNQKQRELEQAFQKGGSLKALVA